MIIEARKKNYTRESWKVLGLAYVKLGTSGYWVWIRTGAVSPQQECDKVFFFSWVAAFGSMGISGSPQAR